MIKMPNSSQELPASSKAPNDDLEDMGVLCSDATAEAETEVLTRDLFGWKRKQFNQTASASRYFIDYTVL